ncbi:hypothetical protein GCM10025867_48010 (plasmid) [Frondihabitans sucicola]|uniref:Uncharacterized protein n=1 Tax=Frondihabitans sucicola TaxID=1268041 RepID=A0ABM8GVR0_9MICO|nr:hypothetical protein [Frondihabitans sucicola]BDZ52560.1 hypothetical protein GCM10025867_48010 [Frondihabitans sucicola]
MSWNVMLSGMNEAELTVDNLTFSSLETTGLVEALAAALAAHWPAMNDVTELARTLDRQRVTLLRRGLNAAGVTILSTSSATLRRSGEQSLYVLRDRARKGFWVDDVIIDVLPGWDQEAVIIDRIRARAVELAPETIQELGPIESLRAGGGQTLWGSIRRRDGIAEAAATWQINEYDSELDLLRGSFTTPRSTTPKLLSAKASVVSGWALGRVPTDASA